MQPRYIQLSNNIKEQIFSGIYNDGDMLPSENELSQLHGITRVTVRQALNELVKNGYIEKRKGKGSFVCQKHKSLGLLSFKGFSDVLAHTDIKVKTKMIVKPELRTWDDTFFYKLSKAEKLSGYIYFERVRHADDEPVMLEKTYIPNLNLPRFCSRPFVQDSFFKTLQQNYGIEILNVQQDIRAREASKKMAVFLGITPGKPIIHMYRKYTTNRNELFIYGSLYCNTEKYFISSNFT